MKTIQIEILNITKKGYEYIIEHFDESEEDSPIIVSHIGEDSLYEFIIDNELNREEFINYRYQNLECDGMDERFIPVDTYLNEHKEEVIKEYLTKNS